MILEFSLENILSVYERTTISLKSTVKDRDNTHTVEMPDGTNILRTAAFFGANGSGKTNILTAFNLMMTFAVKSYREDVSIPPFRFRDDDAPSSFEIIFYLDGKRYIYNLSIRVNRVVAEILQVYEKTQRRLIFSRRNNNIKWGAEIRGDRKSYTDFIRDTASFLSTAGNLGQELIKEVYEGLEKLYAPPVIKVQTTLSQKSTELLVHDRTYKDFVLRLLSHPTFGNIEDIAVTESTEDDYPENRRYEVSFIHRAGERKYPLPLKEESKGTRRIYELAYAIYRERTLEIDEIESSLHPALQSHLLNEILTGNKESQILFTTQNYILLDSLLLSDGGIYFVSKDTETLATKLTRYSSITGIRQTPSRAKLYFSSRLVDVPVYDEEPNASVPENTTTQKTKHNQP